MNFIEESATTGLKYDIKPALKNGLEDIGYTIEELQQNWIYCGSNGGRWDGEKFKHPGRLQYWIQHCKHRGCDETLPDWEPECHCGQKLYTENAYLTTKKPDEDGEYDYIVIGSCCIKTFMPYGLSKMCEDCEQPHKNRKDNKCNDCREKIRKEKEFHRKGKECRGWYRKKICKGVCGMKNKDEYYDRCFNCHTARQRSWKRYEARKSY
jgi:hypothetical protein